MWQGGEGVKKFEIFMDVIDGSPLWENGKCYIFEPDTDLNWVGSFGAARYTWRYVATLPIHKLWITQHHRTTQPGDVYTGTSPTRWPATSPCSSTTPRRPASLSVDSRGPPIRPGASPGTTRCRRNWDVVAFDELVCPYIVLLGIPVCTCICSSQTCGSPLSFGQLLS